MTATGTTSSYAIGDELPRYTVRAHNGAEASENKIHDNDVAQQYGFRGGLVPGVTDYAYMTRPLVEAFGAAWLERGQLSARFLQPIYEGDDVTVVATVTSPGPDAVEFEVNALNSDGAVCAAGSARMPAMVPKAPLAGSYGPGDVSGGRPPASRESLAIGTALPEIELVFGEGDAYRKYLDETFEHLPLFEGPSAYAPSGYLIREANRVLHQNVVLGPWIHVSSDVQHFGLVPLGTHLTTRAIVTGLFERKGHQFVELDVLTLADGERVVMQVAHRAIWDVRKSG